MGPLRCASKGRQAPVGKDLPTPQPLTQAPSPANYSFEPPRHYSRSFAKKVCKQSTTTSQPLPLHEPLHSESRSAMSNRAKDQLFVKEFRTCDSRSDIKELARVNPFSLLDKRRT